jgi:hypothetical protein
MSSLTCRLKAVNEGSDFYHMNDLYYNSFVFTDYDKLLVALNLRYEFYNNNLLSFLVSKKKHLSFFFEITNFHSTCLKILFSYLVLPIDESFGNRCSLGFRPYRDCHDVFYQLKSLFLKRIHSLWFFRANYFSDMKVNFWLKKNFPLDSFIKKFIFSNVICYRSDLINYNLYFVLVRFLLDGLV